LRHFEVAQQDNKAVFLSIGLFNLPLVPREWPNESFEDPED